MVPNPGEILPHLLEEMWSYPTGKMDTSSKVQHNSENFISTTVFTGKITAGGIWGSRSGKTPLAVAKNPDVTPTDVP